MVFSLMSQSIPSLRYHPPPPRQPEATDQKSLLGNRALLTEIVLGGQDLIGAGKFQKIRDTGFIPTLTRFFGIHTEYETEFVFIF